ncbi:MAG: formylglycine-generating enzyme family protein, partial [Planctomycetota bacterium]
ADRYANCGELLVDLELASQGKQPSGVNLDPALTTVALRRKGAQAKGAGRPRAAQPGAAVVRKRTEPVPLEPLDATLLRKDAARGKSEPRPSGSGPLADARGSEGARGHTRLGRKQYIAAGVAGLGLLVLIAALAMKGTSETPSSKSETSANTETAKPDSGTAKVEPVVANAESLPKELSLDLGGGVKMDMVLVPAGDFMMGEKGLAEPVHAVKISKPFYMGKYVVTQEQYQAVIGKNPSGFNGQKNPVENVSWLDAQEFCKKVSQKTGKSVCLPTEAEWEYACRAGTTTKFNTGDKDSDLEQAAWFNKNSVGHMNAVGQKKPNAWGLYDMHGNAWEWVQDYFSDKYYADSPPVDPKGPANGVERVLRGGCWFNNPGGCLAAHRIRYVPDHLGSDVGFRCVLDLAGGGAPVAVQPETPSPKPEPAALPKETALDLGGGVKMDMVLVPAGDFMMGSNDGPPEEKPAHKVKLSKPFYMGKYVVTQEQYEAVIGTNPANFKGPKNPVEQVSWLDAQEFCKKLGQKTGKTVRLPTEAEWEYACRSGTTTRYNTGDKDSDLEQAAWFNKNSGGHTNAVGQKKPDAWGLYDMHGNVWEWCADWFNDKYYQESPPVDPKGPASGRDRVLRGGSWNYYPDQCRAARRGGRTPGNRFADLGFRLALDF